MDTVKYITYALIAGYVICGIAVKSCDSLSHYNQIKLDKDKAMQQSMIMSGAAQEAVTYEALQKCR